MANFTCVKNLLVCISSLATLMRKVEVGSTSGYFHNMSVAEFLPISMRSLWAQSQGKSTDKGALPVAGLQALHIPCGHLFMHAVIHINFCAV